VSGDAKIAGFAEVFTLDLARRANHTNLRERGGDE